MLILDMDMPKSCADCRINTDGNGRCGLINSSCMYFAGHNTIPVYCPIKLLKQEPRWIPVSERLPKELEPVNVTWINHNPESYYADIKDKPFTATGVYFNGQWYWWSTLCTDILAEYSNNYDDIIDDDIEITAWMSLPKPYEPQGSEEK